MAQAELKDVLRTEELFQRASRELDLAAVDEARRDLATGLHSDQQALLQRLVDVALKLCDAGSCGLSVLRSEAGKRIFRWDAMAGAYADHVGGTTPREWSPCGATLDLGSPQLFHRPARFFTYFEAVQPPLVEGLVIPIFIDKAEFGTLWVAAHDEDRKFDLSDVRVMDSLCIFTAAGLRWILDNPSPKGGQVKVPA